MCKISAICALLLLCWAGPVCAQSEQTVNVANNETTAKLLNELLNEVRALRFALQQSTLQQHRSTFLIERIRREQDLVDALEMDRNDLQKSKRRQTAPDKP